MEYVARPRTKVICPNCIIIIKTHSTTSFQCGKCKEYYSVYSYAVQADSPIDIKELRKYFHDFVRYGRYDKPIYRPLNIKPKPPDNKRIVTIISHIKKVERAYLPSQFVSRFT